MKASLANTRYLGPCLRSSSTKTTNRLGTLCIRCGLFLIITTVLCANLTTSQKPTINLESLLKITNLKPNKGEHCLIVGVTGSGKSVLSQQLLPATGNLCIIDPKRMYDTNLPVFTEAKKIIKKKPKRFCYRPNLSEYTDVEAYDMVYRYVYESGDFTVYTDEIVGIMERNKFPSFLRHCYQQGRGKGITMISATQRPKWVPLFIVTEVSRIYAFRLTHPYDVKLVSDMVPGYDSERLRNDWRFGFYYFDTRESFKGSLTRLMLVDKQHG
jgi:energy-coupling factor transporter ATP-binding protein EcfA2